MELATAAAAPRVRFAVCVTGLERSYPEIRWNVRAAIFGLLASSAPQTDIHVFGVRPVNDSWPNARQDLGPLLDTIEDQRPCRAADAPLPMWFTCTRGSKTFRGGDCTRSFQQMMCDLCVGSPFLARVLRACAHAHTPVPALMIRASELRTMQEFDFVSRVRLDMSWEHLMPVPSNLLSSLSNPRYGTIWVPQMNRNGGINDKFAVGTRRAMSTYLSRVRLFEELDMTQLARR
eukprot:6414555-Prymnesium_polylepis.1